jgi:dTDP-4-dehydrorhamnose 3,5-epimerase
MPKYEDGILWNDKSLKFKWPTNKPILAERDRKWGTFIDFKKVYKGF